MLKDLPRPRGESQEGQIEMRLIFNPALFLVLAMGSLAACGGDAQDTTSEAALNAETGPGGEGSTEATSDIVASIDVGYGKINFHKGAPTAYISEQSPADYATTPLDSTIPGHTTLEVFLAVAPNLEPPQELVDSHPYEIANLGRPDAEIVTPAFDANAPVEKASAACKAWVLVEGGTCPNYAQTLKVTKDAAGGTQTLYLNNNSTYMTTSSVTLGVCNDSNTAFNTTLSWDNDGDSNTAASDLTSAPQASVAANQKIRYLNINKAEQPCTPVPPDTICIGQKKPTRYRIAGYAPGGKALSLLTAKTTTSYAPGCVR